MFRSESFFSYFHLLKPSHKFSMILPFSAVCPNVENTCSLKSTRRVSKSNLPRGFDDENTPGSSHGGKYVHNLTNLLKVEVRIDYRFIEAADGFVIC